MKKTKRVDLGDGVWVDVRTKITLGDAEKFEQARLERGQPSDVLDSIGVIERAIVGWSYDESPTPENIREMIGVLEAGQIVEAMGPETPNPSAGSSPGTNTEDAKAKTPAAPQSVG